MVARVATVAFSGTEVLPIDAQVQMSPGVVAFNIVGLSGKAVAESRERVRAALHAMGLSLPAKRIAVTLAPADVLKEGSHFDLPTALGLLAAMSILPAEEIARYVALGARYAGQRHPDGSALRCNAEAEGEILEQVAEPDVAGRALLTRAAEQLKLSARGYHRMMRVVRTIADLAQEEQVRSAHVA